MLHRRVRALLIEDNPGDGRLVRELLAEAKGVDIQLEWVDGLSAGLEHLAEGETDIVLLDLSLPESQGLDTFTLVHRQARGVPIIILTGLDDEDLAVRGVQEGAQDYLVKGQIDGNLLVRAMRYAVERKKVEERLKEAMAIKSRFISMVSHELRTPLTAIREGIGIVLDGITGEPSPGQTEYLSIAKANVDRLARLVNDVLDFQKLDAGKMRFDVCENDIRSMAREVYETMAPAAKRKGLRFSLDAPDDLPAAFFDRDRIAQVLTNLVHNAIKFTEAGAVSIAVRRAEGRVRVSVTDTGSGIERDDMPALFHKFEQLTAAKAGNKGGTGLGLAISKEIVEGHGGRIWAESEPGRGASFHFVLPVAPREAPATMGAG